MLQTFHISDAEINDVPISTSVAAEEWVVRVTGPVDPSMTSEFLGGCLQISSRERLDLSPVMTVAVKVEYVQDYNTFLLFDPFLPLPLSYSLLAS